MKTRFYLMATIAALAFLLGGRPALAQNDALNLTWGCTTGGGGSSSGGALTLQGSIGQYNAGQAAGGDLRLTGGFLVWERERINYNYTIYLPLLGRGM
jgi:hypothetical protein